MSSLPVNLAQKRDVLRVMLENVTDSIVQGLEAKCKVL